MPLISPVTKYTVQYIHAVHVQWLYIYMRYIYVRAGQDTSINRRSGINLIPPTVKHGKKCLGKTE